MKNKLLFIATILLLLTTLSCKKNLTGNAITIEANTNETVTYFRIYRSSEPGPNNLPQGSWTDFTYLGNGNYEFQLEKGYEENCFTITGTILENNDSTGTTRFYVDLYYTEEGNTVGFQELELKRPHGDHQIRYEFRPDTYLEN